MMKYLRWLIYGICVFSQLNAGDCCRQTTMTAPKYCGGFFGDLTWLYLQTAPTDGDFEVGTLLTLSDDPNNLSTILQELEPDAKSAFRANIGYQLPCTNCDFSLSYFYYHPSDSIAQTNLDANQFTQNFLGGSYATLEGWGRQRINQVDFTAGKRFIVDRRLNLHPYVGWTYADISRKMNVRFTNFISADLVDLSALLTGTEKSKYWGIGPVIGTDFSYDLFGCLSLEGKFGGGILFGEVRSKLDSESQLVNDDRTFNAKDSYCRAAALINSQLALVFRPKCYIKNMGLELKIGYESDYYFKTLDRIDPFNGYVLNNNPFPVKTSGNLGLGGPFIQLSLVDIGDQNSDSFDTRSIPHFDDLFCAFYGEVTGTWLKAVPNNNDLVYATLDKSNGSVENQAADVGHSWNGRYKIGYRNQCDLDFNVGYFHFNDKNSTSVTAGEGESIKSVNSSGPVFSVYSFADSKVEYDLDQVDLMAGKCFSPVCRSQLLLSFGVRYANLKRTLHNNFLGGEPEFGSESKFQVVESNYYGVGPIIALDPTFLCSKNLRLTAHFSTAFLMGKLKMSIDQENQGSVSALASSYTLRSPWARLLVPVVDVRAGLNYQCCFPCGGTLNIEVGYQFTDYFRAINHLEPLFLTGLQQSDSDLKLHGPYISLKLANF